MPRLTPGPTSVSGIDELQVSLNGTWGFNPNPHRDSWGGEARTGPAWADIEVPGEWVMQGFTVEKDTAAGYRRQFTLPQDWKGRRIKLRCDAIYSDAKVWVNGLEAGQHVGGFTPFELDISELVEFGRDNTIAIAVKNESVADTLASGTFYAAHQLGGITRKIYLFAVPELNISCLHVDTTFERDYRDASLHIILEIANESTQDIQEAQVQFKLRDAAGKPVTIEPSAVELPLIKAGRTVRQTVEIPVTTPQKWDAEHPNLYVLACQLKAAGMALETVQRRFGFCQVEVRGRELFVNSMPVKLHGICRHEVHPLRGRSLTPELGRKDAELFRNANMNFIRTSHYPPSEEFLDACDELGIFVEDEAPYCWAARWDEDKKDDPNYSEVVVRQTLEMVQRDRSHPCIIIWSAANESTWGPNFEKSAEAIRMVDASRPRIFSWHHTLDIASHHYPGVDICDELAKFDVPVLFDEYMHLNCYNRSEVVTDPGVREDWGRSFARVWEKMYAGEGSLGGAIWSGIDEIFHLPDGKSTGYGPWGPLDGWRRTKPEYWHIKKVYSPIKISAKTVAVPKKGEPIKLEVENRHDFTNLNEIRIEWAIGNDSGQVAAAVPPRSTGTIEFEPKTNELKCKKLSLKFFSPRGFIIDSYLLPIGDSEETIPKSGIQAEELWLLKDENNFVIKGNRLTWVIDRQTGLIQKAEIDGQAVLIGGPTLMVLPLTGGKCEPTYHDDILPFTNTCSQWQVSDVTARQSTDGVDISVKGRYKEASGTYTMHINNKGELTVSYRFSYDGEIKQLQPMWGPLEPARLRQLGIVFDLTKSFDTLKWQRNALWTVYPEDHIGRAEGHAKAFRDAGWPNIRTHTEPPWPWSLDSNALGTNDFRSTKRNIIWASLKDTNDYGILIRSNGRQSTRSYVEGDRIRLLVAEYSTGGRDGVSFGHLGEEQRPFEKGSVFADSIRLELAGPYR
ncbi:MAG: glycoside hydrolase family 2 [Planctomycetota bacterium]|nr:MAG: glycoside hydrolase family 2 [Planctomycetota bacterium]